MEDLVTTLATLLPDPSARRTSNKNLSLWEHSFFLKRMGLSGAIPVRAAGHWNGLPVARTA